ncbi:hypothetical protein LOTGIDRAFT_187193 [Lottia gigantea]|uniref:CRAL-TRIO domain-containing protein n=1 Tax=Lottia gigantea TaxID=225164 RepID=V4AYZ7_LOTGI|nr:hypothetical protein LOTGIDRAFT_187193 [Lottia gigantea]ESO98951.1 hypothetical protein LOTGIDRAFT_187193 [Lottia gigantea]
MFRENVELRDRFDVNNILKYFTPPEVLQKYLAGGLCGHDKDGSPIRIELFGRLDMKGLMYSARKMDMEKTKILQCEMIVEDCRKQSQKLGKKVDQLTVIFDMEGVSSKMLWKPGLQMYMHLVSILEDNYPELLKRMFVVNAPSIFPVLYKICRPLISEDMKLKIHVLGSNYTETLLKYIDPEELPVFLGGKMKDADGNPKCESLICQGGVVPQSYYLKDNQDMSQFKEIVVPNGEKVNLFFKVDKINTILSWEFQTEDFDIGFGVLIQEDGKTVPVVESERVNSHMVPQDGTYTCKQTGTYVICFDNSFSWARDKKVKYNVDVMVDDDCLKSEIETLIDEETQ